MCVRCRFEAFAVIQNEVLFFIVFSVAQQGDRIVINDWKSLLYVV